MVYKASSAYCRRGQWRHRCGRHGTVWIGYQQMAHEPQVLSQPCTQLYFHKMKAVLLLMRWLAFAELTLAGQIQGQQA